jgi:hypothetical protein
MKTATTIVDDRTEEQQRTHTVLMGGIDRCMSGWGGAENRLSRAYWAVPNNADQADSLWRWVASRGDISRPTVYYHGLPGHIRSSGDHIHIYVVRDGHPALSA